MLAAELLCTNQPHSSGPKLQTKTRNTYPCRILLRQSPLQAPLPPLLPQACLHLHMLKPKSLNWQVPALLCSALHNEGVDEVWNTIEEYGTRMRETGELQNKRNLQASDWMWTLLLDDLKEMFMRDRNVESLVEQVQEAVATGVTTPSAAARRLLEAFKRN